MACFEIDVACKRDKHGLFKIDAASLLAKYNDDKG